MKFNEEFNKKFKEETELLTPSEEQTERIIKGVYERLEREKEQEPQISAKPKKPLKIKIAALSGASVCAAAVMIVVIGVRRGYTLNLPNYSGSSINKAENDHLIDAAPGITANGTATSDEMGGLSIAGGSADLSGGFDTEIGNSYTAAFGEGTNEQQPSHSIPSTSVSASGAVYLKFTGDKEGCVVNVNGKITNYRKPLLNDFDSGFDEQFDSESSVLVNEDQCSLGIKLLLQFDGDDLYIFYGSGEFFGIYTAD